MIEAVRVYLLDTTTGVRRVYETTEDTGRDGLDFQWREGNYSCDCNRALFFARAGHEEEPFAEPCGTSRYVVERIVRRADSEILYTEKPITDRK